MYDAPALATPAAIVPTPRPATSLTPIRARRVDGPQVGDQLGEVLDRVDVVVRRRADVALPGLAATQRGDVGGGLATRQLAALAGLRALGDLDLELVRAGEIGGRDAEPGRGDLLDPGVASSTVRHRACTRPGPRHPHRCWPTRRRAGCRSSAPGAPRATARRRSSPRRRTGARSSGRPRPLSSGDRRRPGARAARRAGPPGVRPARARAIAGEAASMPPGSSVVAERRDLARDLRREQVGLAVRAEPGPARIGQLRLAPGDGRGDRRRRPRAAELAVGEIREGRATRPRCRRSGSSVRRPTHRGRPRRSARRRCTRRPR